MNRAFRNGIRCWLSQSCMRQLGLVVSVAGAMAGLVSWMIKPSPPDAALTWWIRIVSVLCFVVPITAAWWMSRIPDLAPNFLSATRRQYFEADGFCFLPMIEQSGGRGSLVIAFENRYTTPCTVEVSLKPTRVAFKDISGLEAINLRFSCPPGGAGTARRRITMPLRFSGKQVLYDVTATARFPNGRGRELRFRPGTRVGKVGSDKHQDLKQVLGFFAHFTHLPNSGGSPARVSLAIPSGIEPQDLSESPADCDLDVVWSLSESSPPC